MTEKEQSMGKKHPKVTHLSEVEPRVVTKGTRFGFKTKKLGLPSGSVSLGCSWYEIEPGRTSFPKHFHCANEEAIFILEGSGETRIGTDTVAVEAGDYIAYPVGPEFAHTIKNTGNGPLRYVCVSTMIRTEIVGYPDSKKIGAVGLADPVTGIMGAKVMALIKEQPPVDYYDGEDIG